MEPDQKNGYEVQCVAGVVKLVKVGDSPCYKKTRALEETQPMEVQSRSIKCSANGEEKWDGSRLDKVVEDCVWIECNGDTGKYEFVQNQFCICPSKFIVIRIFFFTF